MDELQNIRTWLTEQSSQSTKRLRKVKSPNVLFLHSGSDALNKVQVIAKEFKKEVYRVDLSMVVSKYIGETEKNLTKIFDTAKRRDWILFFDEADALFGKRSDVKDSHDRYANQEVSYLLQRIQEFDGFVILASNNNKKNIDPVFIRRLRLTQNNI